MFSKCCVLVCLFISCWSAEGAVIYSSTTPDLLEVQLSMNDYVVQESSGEVCLRVVANSTSSKPFSVYVMPIIKEPIAMSASSGDDFNSSVHVVNFNAGQTKAVVCIPIYADRLKEGDETFSVLLSVPSNNVLIPGQHLMASVTILDDKTNAGSETVKGSTYSHNAIHDKIKRCGCKPLPTATPTPAVSTSPSPSATPTPVTMTPSSAPSPSPSPVVCIGFGSANISVNESDQFVAFDLVQNGSSTDNITVFITIMMQNQPGPSTQSPAIRVSSLMVNIPARALFSGIIPIRIELLDDNIVEPLEFYQLMLGLAEPVDSSVKLGDINTTYIVVEDDDMVCIEFGRVSTSVIESDGLVTINLIANGSSLENITAFITILSQDPSGSSTESPAINVTRLMISIPSLMDGVVPITIELFDDSIVEPFEFYELTLELDDNNNTNVKLGDLNITFIVVQDNDNITVAFNSTEYSGAEADGLIPVTVVATGTASIPYTVIITPSESDPRSAREGIDYSNEAVEVTFNPGETEKTVDIVINPDCLREGSEFFNLSLSLPIGAPNLDIFLGDPSGAVAEIEDTDVIYVNFSQALYSAEEQDGVMTLTLEADMVSIWPFSVEVIPMEIGRPDGAIGGGVDFISDPVIAVFTPGTSQVNVSINIIKDNMLETPEMLKFNLAIPDEFSNITGKLLVKTGDNDMADGEIISSEVLVNFSASSYDIELNETMATVRVTAFGEFRNPFLVNVTVSTTEQSERTEAFFTPETIEVLFPVTINTALVTIRVFPEELRSGEPGVFNVMLEETSASSNVCVIIGSPSQATVIIPSPFAK